MEWQPIKTAPKDGTPILIWDGKIQCVVLHCRVFPDSKDDEGWWECIGDSGVDEYDNALKYPTHWMPLPEPPKE